MLWLRPPLLVLVWLTLPSLVPLSLTPPPLVLPMLMQLH
jgi:hypothetical protein